MKTLIASLMLSVGVAASQQPAPTPGGTPSDTSAATIEAGRKVFHGSGTCFACHGGKLQGGPVGPPLTGPTWKNIHGGFDEILHVIRTGIPGTVMISHPGGINDDKTLQVATYIWAVSHDLAKP